MGVTKSLSMAVFTAVLLNEERDRMGVGVMYHCRGRVREVRRPRVGKSTDSGFLEAFPVGCVLDGLVDLEGRASSSISSRRDPVRSRGRSSASSMAVRECVPLGTATKPLATRWLKECDERLPEGTGVEEEHRLGVQP